ncbi:MAG: O-antigen ligase family protein [Candidatus Aquilonibacter sp.]
MPYHPIVERFPIVPALDPLWLMFFAVLFAGCALLTLRRPGLGAALLVFVTPFAGAHAIWGTTVTAPKVVLVGVIVGLLGTPRAWMALRRGPVAAVAVAFCAIILANAMTLVVAVHRPEVVRETLKWTEYLGLFCAVFITYTLDPLPRIVRSALFVSFTFAACSAFLELATGAVSGLALGATVVPRIAGVLEGPNQFGGYLEAAIAAIGAWQIRAPQRTAMVLITIAGVALALTLSRAALVGALVIVAVFAVSERKGAFALWPLALGLAAGYCNDIAWALRAHVPWGNFFARESDVDAAVSGGVGDRSELWRAARFFFFHHPILGIGAGNYELELSQAGVPGVRTQANNWYLQAAAEGGVVLLGATIAWIVTVVRALITQVRHSPWALAALGASAAFIVHGFFDDLVFYPKVAEAWIALIALGIANPGTRE